MLGSLYDGSAQLASGLMNAWEGTGVTGINPGSIAGASLMAPWSLVQAGAQALGIPMEWLIPAP